MTETQSDRVIRCILGDPRKRRWYFWLAEWWRIDRLFGLSMCVSFAIAAVFIYLSVCLMENNDTVRSGAHLLIAAVAVLGFSFGTFMRRKERIGETTKEVLAMWQSRREELWKDKHLSNILSADQGVLEPQDKFMLKNYLHTVFDLLEYAIHLCSNGYFSPPTDVAHQYVPTYSRDGAFIG